MKMLKSLLLGLLIFFLWVLPVSAVGDPYWPWIEGNWINYQVFKITGTWYNDPKIDPCLPGGTCKGTGYEFYAIDWGGK